MTATMTCPRCGNEMNHQASKLVQPVTMEESGAMTPELDGVILEVFACPVCGWIESRRVTSSG